MRRYMTKFNSEKIKELDGELNSWYQLYNKNMPDLGWIKSIRSAFGITTRALAQRMNLSQSRIVHMEKGEIDGNLTLDTLKAAAKAMDCKLVYAIVPDVSLEYVLKKRITKLAKERVSEKYSKMDEVIMLSKAEMEKRIVEEAVNIVEKDYKEVWN